MVKISQITLLFLKYLVLNTFIVIDRFTPSYKYTVDPISVIVWLNTI